MPGAIEPGSSGERVSGRKRPWSERRSTWIVLALLVLLVAVWGASAQRRRGEIPRELDTAGLPYPMLVEGTLVGSQGELVFLAHGKRAGESLDLGPSAAPLVLVHEVSLAGLWLTLLSALTYVAVCALVLAPRAHLASARALTLAMACACLGIAVGGIYPPNAPGEGLLLVAFVVALCFMPLAFVALTLRFPVRRTLLNRSLALTPLLGALGVVVAAWNSVTWLAYAGTPSPQAWAHAMTAYRAIEVLLVGGFAVGSALLIWAGRHAPYARERAQARWLLWGIVVAATPFVFLRCLPRLLGLGDAPIPPEVDRVVELAAPAAFAIAVAKHRLFDIDAVIRRSLIASVLALLLATAALGVVLLLGRLCPDPIPLPSEAVWLAAGALAAALFLPLRRGVGRWVDRTFFRIRHEHGLALRALVGPLAQAPSPAAVARLLERAVEAELEPTSLSVRVAGPSDSQVPWPTLESLAWAGLGDGLLRARSEATTVEELEGVGLPVELSDPAVALVQPLSLRGRLWGALLLGPKEGGHRYVEQDLSFLAAVAAEAAPTLERLDLVRTLAAESSAREALATLDRQRRDFLLRVAHDLRTPLTAVRWSAANLKDGLSGDLSPGQGEELVGILAASGQLARLVDNLVALSRMEMGAPGAAAEPVALGPLVGESLASLRPVAQAKGVRIEQRLEKVPHVRGRREALAQVVQNLIDNAIKYAPTGTAIEVSLDREAGPGGPVRLRVRDHGPGLGGKDPATLFDLFRQGAASPHSSAQGLGVGLHVVKSWITAFGGSAEGAEAPGGGAVFTCRMACWEADLPAAAGGGA